MSSLLALADEGSGGGLGEECPSEECPNESSNTQTGPFNNINVWGSQQDQQGSCNVQQNNDSGALIGDFLSSYLPSS